MITKIHIIDLTIGNRTGQTRNYNNFYVNTSHSYLIKPTTTMAKEARRAWNQTQQWSSAVQL